MFHTEYVEWDENKNMTSGPKGMGDIYKIIDSIGGRAVVIPSVRTKMDINIFERISIQKKIYKNWIKAGENLEAGDWLMLDIPVLERFIYLPKVIKWLSAKGIRIALFIADLELVTEVKYEKAGGLKAFLIHRYERLLLDKAEKILTHNDAYEKKLRELGVDCEIHKFELFDYLAPNFNQEIAIKKRDKAAPIIIAGNLHPSKVGYLKELPGDVSFNLYGVHYHGKNNETVCYKGAFHPEILMEEMEGSFGLVWDGDSADTCTGIYGRYLRYNIPHKTSLYLASGIPVIIWKEAAMARFILENNCGLVVDKLADIKDVLEQVDEEQYNEMVEAACAIGEKLRAGFYTKRVIKEAFGDEVRINE